MKLGYTGLDKSNMNTLTYKHVKGLLTVRAPFSLPLKMEMLICSEIFDYR